MKLESEKIFRHGTTSPDIYSFTQHYGVSSTGLIDFTTRMTWCVTKITPHVGTQPISCEHWIPRWDKCLYGCFCANLHPKTFSPILLYHDSSFHSKLQDSNKTESMLPAEDNQSTPELRQRLLMSTQYYRGSDLFFRSDNLMRHQNQNALNRIVGNISDKVDANDLLDYNDLKSKKYKCQYCSVTCTNNGQLRGHLRVHTGEKPYRCDFTHCDRSFARNEELTRHRRIHSGIRPHHCQTCDKYFGRKDHLTKHLKTHLKAAEKKSYLCTIPGCEQKYTRSDALARHQWSNHGIKPKTTKCKHVE